MAQPQQPPPVPAPEVPTARHLGDLVKSETRWSVFLETRLVGTLAQGRLHFVEGPRTKSTGWIFREWTEQDIIQRFNEFGAVELLKILESLG